MIANFRFGIMGPLEVWDGKQPIPVAAAKQRVLLAYLLLRIDRSVTLAELYSALWGEQLPAAPKAAVHNYVRRLRGSLHSDVIATTPAGYRLVVDTERVDLYRFRDLFGQARLCARNGDLINESALLREALALWRGAPLADIPSDLLERYEVPGLVEERLAALERRITVDLELGFRTELISELRVLTSEFPLRERFWSQLILALHRDERSADALAAYHQARGILAEETGIDPGPELRALYRGVLDGDPRLAAPPPPSVAIISAGPAPRRLTPPSQIPPEVADFVGRQGMANRLTQLLAPETVPTAPPVIVLFGAPGVGKTALATHVAHRVRSRFPDGQLYANLRGYGLDGPVAPAELLPRFLLALGAAPESIPIDLDEQAALYRSLLADRQVLVVLDNANSPDQIRPFLPAEPRCVVLVTSRDSLQGPTSPSGARHLRVDVLEPLSAVQLLQAVIGGGRVLNDLAGAAELARMCGHIPLALRIAGANLAGRPNLRISGYVAELDTEDRLLALAAHGDEQAAVYGTFAHSYAALDPQAQLWFRRLGPALGPEFAAPTAAALLDAPIEVAEAMLRTIAAANLVDDHVPGRYQFHDLLRFYAARLGTADNGHDGRTAARGRVLNYYINGTSRAAGAAEPHRSPPALAGGPASVSPELPDRARTISRVEDERPGARAAAGPVPDFGPRPSWQPGDSPTSYLPRYRTGRVPRHGHPAFRDRVTADGSSGFPAESGRYRLCVAAPCPFSQCSLIALHLKGLTDVVSVSTVHPTRDGRGWTFLEGAGHGPDEVKGFTLVSEAYLAPDTGYDEGVCVPVLWDSQTGRVVSNDHRVLSTDLATQFDAFARNDIDLYPSALRPQIDDMNGFLAARVHDGPYRCGFASSQDEYEREIHGLFSALDELEARLADRRYLFGDSITESDIRLWVTLARFDSVYTVHFRANLRRIVEYPNLWAYARDLYQLPAFRDTTDLEQIKRHYFRTHPWLNPTGIVPAGPTLDWSAPPGRAGLNIL